MDQDHSEHLAAVDQVFHLSPELRDIYRHHQAVSPLPRIDPKNSIVTPICRVRKRKLPISGWYGNKVNQMRQQIQKLSSSAMGPHTKRQKYLQRPLANIEAELKHQKFNQKSPQHYGLLKQKTTIYETANTVREQQVMNLLSSYQKAAVYSNSIDKDVIKNISQRSKSIDRKHNQCNSLILVTGSHRKPKRKNRSVLSLNLYSNSPISHHQKAKEDPISLSPFDASSNHIESSPYSKEDKYATVDDERQKQEENKRYTDFKSDYFEMLERLRGLLHKRQRVSFVQKIINSKSQRT